MYSPYYLTLLFGRCPLIGRQLMVNQIHINQLISIRLYFWKSLGNAKLNMRETLPRYVPGKRNYRESPSKRRRLRGTQDLWIDQGSGQPWIFSPRTMNIQADIDSPCKTNQASIRLSSFSDCCADCVHFQYHFLLSIKTNHM